jgi:predicted RNA-binding protein associated with RNAse of E/G family
VKRKRADRAVWKRVKKRIYEEKWVESEAFTGYAVQITLQEVDPPGVMSSGETSICIADNGYRWQQFFPHGTHYAVTKMVNERGEVVQWYIDICKQHGRDEQGILWYDDLYLDIVVFPDGQTQLLDQDELDDALEKGLISREEHQLACLTAEQLLREIRENKRNRFDFPSCFE